MKIWYISIPSTMNTSNITHIHRIASDFSETDIHVLYVILTEILQNIDEYSMDVYICKISDMSRQTGLPIEKIQKSMITLYEKDLIIIEDIPKKRKKYEKSDCLVYVGPKISEIALIGLLCLTRDRKEEKK